MGHQPASHTANVAVEAVPLGKSTSACAVTSHWARRASPPGACSQLPTLATRPPRTLRPGVQAESPTVKTRHEPVTAESQKRELTSAPGTKGPLVPGQAPDRGAESQAPAPTLAAEAATGHWAPRPLCSPQTASPSPRRGAGAGRREVDYCDNHSRLVSFLPAPRRENGNSGTR